MNEREEFVSYKKTIPYLCKKYRMDNHLTVAELAERLEVSIPTVYCYERGASKCPKAALRRKMEELFEVEITVRRSVSIIIS